MVIKEQGYDGAEGEVTILSRAERSSYIPGRGLQHHCHYLGQLPQHAGGAEGGEAHHLTHTLHQGQGGAVLRPVSYV